MTTDLQSMAPDTSIAQQRPLRPLTSALAATQALLARRIHLRRSEIDETVELDGLRWRIFRSLAVDPATGDAPAPAEWFVPRFHVAGMSPRVNMLFSWLPIPLYIGLPGFRSKRWLVEPQSGDFMGIYEWSTRRDAENYGRSYAARFMTKRSAPGSVSFEVIERDSERGREILAALPQ